MLIFVNVGQAQALHWKQTNGPYGGYIRCFAVRDSTIFAGTWRNGVYRSTDGGESWTRITQGLTELSVFSLAVSGPIVVAATDSIVFRSTNNGDTWTRATGLDYLRIVAVVANGSAFFAGSSTSGLYCSTNGGAQWTYAKINMADNSVDALAVRDSTLIIGTHFGINIVNDSAGTWSPVKVTYGLSIGYASPVALIGNTFFTSYQNGGVLRSTDNGKTWVQRDSGMANAQAVSITGKGSRLFAAAWGGVYRSTNNGDQWTQVNSGLGNTSLWALAECGTVIFAGTNGGMYRSRDSGRTWQLVTAGLQYNWVRALCATGSTILAGTEETGVFPFVKRRRYLVARG